MKKTTLITILLFILAPFISLRADGYDDYGGGIGNMMSNMMGGFYGWGGFGWGWLMMIFWWALLLIIIFLVVKWLIGLSNQNKEKPETKSPLNILKERYAKGEINKEEFEQKKKDVLE